MNVGHKMLQNVFNQNILIHLILNYLIQNIF